MNTKDWMLSKKIKWKPPQKSMYKVNAGSSKEIYIQLTNKELNDK